MSKWQKVFSDKQEYRAEIVRAVLEDKGLNPVLISKQDSSIHNWGYFEVHVEPTNVLSALQIIKDDIKFG